MDYIVRSPFMFYLEVRNQKNSGDSEILGDLALKKFKIFDVSMRINLIEIYTFFVFLGGVA